MAKCVKNARDHIKRDAALEMEEAPPKPGLQGHNFTSAVRFTDVVGRVVKSTDPAISPFHYMAEKMSGKRSIYLLLPIHGRNRTSTTKGGRKAW